MHVHSVDDLTRLIRLLRSPTRLIPLIVISQNATKEAPVITGMRLQRKLGETGIVRTLSGRAFPHFNKGLAVHPLRGRGVRLYEPNYEPWDKQDRHPFWGEFVVDQLGEDYLIDIIATHCADAVPKPTPEIEIPKVERPRRPLLRAKKVVK